MVIISFQTSSPHTCKINRIVSSTVNDLTNPSISKQMIDIIRRKSVTKRKNDETLNVKVRATFVCYILLKLINYIKLHVLCNTINNICDMFHIDTNCKE